MENGSEPGWGTNSRQLIKDKLNYSEQKLTEIEEALGTSAEGTFDSLNKDDSSGEYAEDYAEVGAAEESNDVVLRYSGDPSQGDVASSIAIGKMLQLDRKGQMDVIPDKDGHNQELYSGFIGALARSNFEPLHISPQRRNQLKAAKMDYKKAKQKAHEKGLKEDLDSLVKEHAATIGDSVITDEEVRTDLRKSIGEYAEARKKVLPLIAAKHMEVFEEGKQVSDFILPDKNTYEIAIHYMKGFEETICGYEPEK